MSKIIKLTLSDDEFKQYELHARKNNHPNVAKLAKFLMKQESSRELVSRSAAPEVKPSPNFSAEFVRKFMIQPEAHQRVTKGEGEGEVKSSGGKRPDLEYAVRGEEAYPLFKQLGARLPCLDYDEAFHVPLYRLKHKQGWVDITSQLSEMENRWLDLWRGHFEVMDGLWWYQTSKLEQADEDCKLRHYVEIINWFDNGKTADKLLAERRKGLARRTFAERTKEYTDVNGE